MQALNLNQNATQNGLRPLAPNFPFVPTMSHITSPYVPRFTPRSKVVPTAQKTTTTKQKLNQRSSIVPLISATTKINAPAKSSTTSSPPSQQRRDSVESSSKKKSSIRVQIPWSLQDNAVEELAVQCIYKSGIWDPENQKSIHGKKGKKKKEILIDFKASLKRKFNQELCRVPTWEAIKNRVEAVLKEHRAFRAKQKKITGDGDRK